MLHSGESKTAVFAAEKLNSASMQMLMKSEQTSFLLMRDYVPLNGQAWMTIETVVLIQVT